MTRLGEIEKNGIIPEDFYGYNPMYSEETEECKICGESLDEDEDKFYTDRICNDCAKKLLDQFNSVVGKAIKDNFTKEEWEIINDVIYDGTHLLEYFEY